MSGDDAWVLVIDSENIITINDNILIFFKQIIDILFFFF